jgi:hypothetical protein
VGTERYKDEAEPKTCRVDSQKESWDHIALGEGCHRGEEQQGRHGRGRRNGAGLAVEEESAHKLVGDVGKPRK